MSILNKGGRFEKVLSVAERMREKNITFSEATYFEIIAACSKLRDWKTTTKMMKEMEPSLPNLSIGLLNHVLRSIGKSGKVEGMMKIFYKLEEYRIEPTLETYNILLDNLLAVGKWRKCVEILNWLETTRLQPPLSIYEKVLNFLEKEGNMEYVVLVREKIEKMQLGEIVAVT